MGRLQTVTHEQGASDGEVEVALDQQTGLLHADLRIGANVVASKALRANLHLSNRGVQLFGAGFIVTREEAAGLGLGLLPGLDQHIREYRNGKDLTARPRDVLVIDLFGLDIDAVRQRFPAVFQWVLERIKPERDQNNRESRKRNWWLFGETNPKLRKQLCGLPRYIATVETSKHRHFQFLDARVLPDNMLVAIASPDALLLGVLSSDVHVQWALAAGGRLGVGNDPRYNKSRCFEPFPFPADDTGLTPALADRIRALAEAIDAHRKARQALHAEVTLTGLYNVLEKLRSGEALTAKDKALHELGLVGVLKSLHDELDAAVLQAYGWADLALPADTETLLERLVALNARRAAEEAAGTVRWLRPEFQQGQGAQAALPGDEAAADDGAEAEAAPAPAPKPQAARPWPAGLTEQIKAVAEVLGEARRALALDEVTAHFSGRGRWRDRLPTLLDTLVALGRLRQDAAGRWADAAR